MTREEFLDALDALVAEKHLLKHPFYWLWTQGRLTKENLREYAISYYPHVAAFPTYVSGVHAGCEDAALRQELLENLIEEERGPENHPALWRRFAAALGAAESDLSAAAAHARGGRGDRRVPPLDAGGLDGRRPGRALRVRVPDPRDLEDEARGPRLVLRNRRPRRDRFFTVHEKADVWHRQVEREALGRVAETPEDRERALAAAGRCFDALNRALDGVMRENALVC